MDWELVAKFGPLVVGVAAALTVGVNVWTQIWLRRERLDEQRFRREEKLDEQRALRGDNHRSDLRRAYAEFIGSYSELLTFADRYNGLFDDLEDGSPANPSRADVDAQHALLAKAMLDTQVTLAELLLLEDDPTAVQRLIPFLESPLRWPDDNRYEQELQTHRERHSTLVRALSGAFSPMRWEKRSRRVDDVTDDEIHAASGKQGPDRPPRGDASASQSSRSG